MGFFAFFLFVSGLAGSITLQIEEENDPDSVDTGEDNDPVS